MGIFRSAIRSFFITFAAVLGIGAAFIPLIFLFAVAVKGTDDDIEIKTHYTPRVVPNASDVRKTLSSTAPVILKINVDGIIGTPDLSMHSVKEQLVESREGDLKDGRVKAILVHINSPGGTVTDSDGIYRAIKEYKELHKIPVYAYIDGLCASGGMYVASAADKVYASDVSLIGSVGVLSPSFFNVVGLMEKIGVDTMTLSAGKGKDYLNPFRKWKEGEEDSFKTIIDSLYNHFVDVVAAGRPELNRKRLVNDYGALIFSAAKAQEYGFIDGTGSSLNETLTLLAKQIGIDDDYYQVVKLEKKISLQDILSDTPMMMGAVRHKIDLSPLMDPTFMNQFLYLYLPHH